MRTPWAILRLKFEDDGSEPFDDTFYRDLFTESGVGDRNLFEYFRDISHGNVDLAGTRVLAWYTIPHARSEYTTLLSTMGRDPARGRLLEWVREAAAAQGVRLADFFGFVACFNVQTDVFGGFGYAVTDHLSMAPAILGQEMGHGYGLSHSRADGSSEDYQDQYDIMSASNSWMTRHPRFGSVGPLLNAWNMRSRGWLDEARVWRPREDVVDEVVELRPHVRRDLPGWLAAEIPGGYLVELRLMEGWDASIRIPGVQVHRFEGNNSYVMGPSSLPVFGAGGVWELGSATGPRTEAHVRVAVQSIDPDGRTARIHVVHRPADLPGLGVFFRGAGDALAWRAHDGGRWHGEEAFGAGHPTPTRLAGSDAAENGPSVVHAWTGHRFAVFFRGTDARLRWKAHHGGRWHPDALIDGGSRLESQPCVVRDGQRGLAAFYRTWDSWLAWRSFDERWHGEERFDSSHAMPSRSLGAPAVVTNWRAHRFAVFFRGLDRLLHWKAFHGGRWHGDAIVEGGGPMSSDPAVVRFGPDRIAVFYRGANDALVWRTFDGARWHGEERFDGAHPVPTRMASAPTVVANWAGHRFAVFFRGPDGRLRWKAHAGGRWHADAMVDGGNPISSSPLVVPFA